MKKFISIFLVMLMVLSMVGCSSEEADDETAVTETYEIAVVISDGELMDGDNNQAMYEGVQSYAEANSISFNYYEPSNSSEITEDERITDAFNRAIEDGAKVIVTTGSSIADTLEAIAAENPDVKFIYVDGETLGYNNITVIGYKEQEAGYLAGYAAVMEGFTSLGFSGGGNGTDEIVNRYGYGFIQGANAAASSIGATITIKYSYSNGETYAASTELQEQMSNWYAGDIQVIFTCGGEMYESVLAASEGYEDAHIICVDEDQTTESERVVLNTTKDVATAVEYILTQYYAGEWDTSLADAVQYLGVSENVVGLETDSWSLTVFTIDNYTELIDSITTGVIVVDGEVLEDCNNADWLTGFSNVTIEFENYEGAAV